MTPQDREAWADTLDSVAKELAVGRIGVGAAAFVRGGARALRTPILHEQGDDGAWICCCGDHLHGPQVTSGERSGARQPRPDAGRAGPGGDYATEGRE